MVELLTDMPCAHTYKLSGVLLSCDLRLIVHKIHHDPSGLWWTECTLHPH